MTDEEKKAIEYLKRHIIPCYGRKGTIEFMLNDTILNLIEKQSKEIEENKKYIVQLTDEQYRKLVDIIRDETGKEWENKIKAKIEEYEEKIKKIKEKDVWEEPYDTEKYVRYTNYISVLQSLLEKE